MPKNKFEIEDISLAEKGLETLIWTRERMPIMRHLQKELARTKPFEGLKIGICLHVEPKTAVWLETLLAGGAKISITGSPGTTKDETAAALVKEFGVGVFAKNGETFEDHLRYCEKVLEFDPDLIADNGGDLHALIQTEEKFTHLKTKLIGANEETTTGGFRLREEIGELPFPTIVINDSRAKRIIENRYGVGQSVVDAIMRSTRMLVGGLKVAVVGYGYCGRGTALCLKSLGARVTVVEIDPLTQLDALLEGFDLADLDEAVTENEMIVTVTGRSGILTKEHFEKLRPGTILANAGHFEFEMDVAGLREMARRQKRVSPDIESFELENGRRIFLLGKGNPINLSAGDGNPIEVMDLGLALQTLSLVYHTKKADKLKNEPQNVPFEVEREVSEMALKAWNS